VSAPLLSEALGSILDLAPSHLAPACEWSALPGLGSGRLPMDIGLQLAPIRHTSARAPAFNFKKAHWDKFEECISEHPPLPIEKV